MTPDLRRGGEPADPTAPAGEPTDPTAPAGEPTDPTAPAGEPTDPMTAAPDASGDHLPWADAGRRRAVIENVVPVVDAGRFPIKRVIGDRVHVEADAFADGHDIVETQLLHRHESDMAWTDIPMDGPDNDRWWADIKVDRIGRYQYTVRAWTDRFSSWQRDLRKRIEAGQDVAVDLRIGAELVAAAAERAAAQDADGDAAALRVWAGALAAPDAGTQAAAVGLDGLAAAVARRHPDLREATTQKPPLEIVVDRARARFSAWYELFPRSTSPDPGRHGTFTDVIARLDYVAGMGFDVLYLPPIHPIGRSVRKGPNNVEMAGPGDAGVPWAIGATEGGHTAIHGELGTIVDFRTLVSAAQERGMEIALDIAFQAAPDHPWVKAHPTWFRARPDGTIQYAENPPKNYQDIYPFDFESDDWRDLWLALRDVFRYWIRQGVRIFRVDNPHTKAFPFWEWCITSIKREDPDTLFLAEAFTRPKPMQRLAKLGFSQSYTYFTWRNTAREMAAYITELTTTEIREFFRPNFWPNTPDILHADLVNGGRPAFVARFVLAATLSSNYGIYGPAFELGANTPREPGSEEYLDSEKYQQRTWNLDDPASLRPLITAVNRVRRDHPALQRTEGTQFHLTGNDQLLAYTRERDGDAVLVVVSFDAHNVQTGTLEVDMTPFGVGRDGTSDMIDVLSGTRHSVGRGMHVALDPAVATAMLLVRASDEERNR